MMLKHCGLALLFALIAAVAAAKPLAAQPRAAHARDAARPDTPPDPAPAAGRSYVYSGGVAGKDERLAEALPAEGGGFFLFGETNAFGAGMSDLWALRLDAAGEPLWQYAYGGPGAERARRLWPTADGGCVLLAETESFGAGGSDAWVLKLDARGRVEWQKTLGGPWDDEALALAPAAAGAFIFGGHVAYPAPPLPPPPPGKKRAKKDEEYHAKLRTRRAWVFKLNADGSLAWQRQFRNAGGAKAGEVETARVAALAPAGGGVYLAGGYADGRALIFKIAEDSSPVADPARPGHNWAYWYHEPDSEGYTEPCYEENCIPTAAYKEFRSEVTSVLAAPGGFLVAGERWAISRQHWVARLDAEGSVTHATNLGSVFNYQDMRPADFARAADGGYFLSGVAERNGLMSFLSKRRDLAVLKFDEAGGPLWKRIVKTPDVNVNRLGVSEGLLPKFLVRPLPGGGYMLARHLGGKTKEWRAGRRPPSNPKGGLVLAKWDGAAGAADCVALTDAKMHLRAIHLKRTPALVEARPEQIEARPAGGVTTPTAARRAPACRMK